MESFYIYLPSTDDTDKSNTQSNYRIQLPIFKRLTGKWEVCLSEIIYPHTWDTIQFITEKISGMKENEIFLESVENKPITVRIPVGYYRNIEGIIETINKRLNKYKVKLDFYDISKRCGIIFLENTNIKKIRFSEKLRFILGFENKDLTSSQLSKYPFDIKANFYSIFVYSNLITPTIVGSSSVRLLRIVPVDGAYGDTVIKSFSAPQYLPLAMNELNEISINLKDNQDKHIPFSFGEVILTLHFRRVKPPY